MIKFAKRVIRAMPVKSKLIVAQLGALDKEEDVLQFLVEHEYYGILTKLFGEDKMNQIVDQYEGSDVPNDTFEVEDVLEKYGDPAKELGLLETDNSPSAPFDCP